MTVRNSAAVCLGLYLESRAGQAGVARCTSVSRPPQPRPEPAPACQHTPSHTPSHLLCHLLPTTHGSQSGEDDTQDISTIISLPPASLPLPGLQAAPPHIVPPPPSSPPTATQPSSSYLQTFSTLNHLI